MNLKITKYINEQVTIPQDQLDKQKDLRDFQSKRVAAFDRIQDRLSKLMQVMSNAKVETSDYYNTHPDSEERLYPTDIIDSYLDEIEEALKDK